jgi:hypothetical protein
MPKLYKYQKITDNFTTYALAEPDYNLLETEDRITELCTIEGVTYVSVPDSIILPAQPEEITTEEAALTEELIADIRAVSLHILLINDRVVAKIRERYSVNDELKLLRIGLSEESTVYNDYIEECRAWGRGEKAKLGL